MRRAAGDSPAEYLPLARPAALLCACLLRCRSARDRMKRTAQASSVSATALVMDPPTLVITGMGARRNCQALVVQHLSQTPGESGCDLNSA